MLSCTLALCERCDVPRIERSASNRLDMRIPDNQGRQLMNHALDGNGSREAGLIARFGMRVPFPPRSKFQRCRFIPLQRDLFSNAKTIGGTTALRPVTTSMPVPPPTGCGQISVEDAWLLWSVV